MVKCCRRPLWTAPYEFTMSDNMCYPLQCEEEALAMMVIKDLDTGQSTTMDKMAELLKGTLTDG